MRRIFVFVIVLLLSLAVSAPISAQESDPTGSDSGTITVVQTIPVMASVEITINGETFTLKIPATVNIDAQAALEDAIVRAQDVSTVGAFDWRIVDISEEEEEYVYDQYQSTTVSSEENKLVIVTSEATNLSNRPIDLAYSSIVDAVGYDELGNTYDIEDRFCGSIDPNETGECVYVFDVPADIEIIGLDIEAVDYKRINLQPTEGE